MSNNPLPRTKLVLAGVGLGLALACAGPVDDLAADDLGAVVVPNEDFDFATTRKAELRLTPAREDAPPRRIEVLDAEGRRLFAGALRGPQKLQFRLPKATAPRVTLVAGRSDAAETTVLDLSEGRGAAAY